METSQAEHENAILKATLNEEQICTQNANNSNEDTSATITMAKQILASEKDNDTDGEKENEATKDQAFKEKMIMKANKRSSKIRNKSNRELNKLEESQIIHSRLRSESGKVYSSSVLVEPNSASSSTEQLNTLEEETSEECTMDCCKKSDQIISMISRLQSSVDDINKKFQTQEITQSNTNHRVQDLQDKYEEHDGEIDDLQAELKETQFQLKLVTSIVSRQEQQIGFLSRKITEIQQREMSANVVISGIQESPNEKPIQLFNNFVTDQLELQVYNSVHRAYRIGTGETRPIIAELRDPDQKRKLFGNANKLKGKQNPKGNYYFMSDHLPEELNEERRRVNQLFAENKKKPKGYKLEMELKRGELIINQEPYKKALKVPTTQEIVNPSEAMYKQVEDIDIVKGGEEHQGNSTFASFAAAVESIEDVRAAYLKLKMKYADATHISCAFRLPGANTPANQDYVDDGEFGCGRTMLKTLKTEGLMNVAVFVMRYYGGKHLGIQRYNIFRQLTNKAVKELLAAREKDGQDPVTPVPEHLKLPTAPEDWSNDDEGWTTVGNATNKGKKTD